MASDPVKPRDPTLPGTDDDRPPDKPGETGSPPLAKLPCCPPVEQGESCDRLDLRYLIRSRAVVRDRAVTVQLIFHYRLERCSLGLVQGDLAYTTTLLPGEQVRLFSSDRHSRWSFDSESSQSYRHETTSEESYLTWGIARAVSDLNLSDSSSGSSSSGESWAEGGGGASVNLFGLIEIGGGGGGGSRSAEAAFDVNRQLSQHAETMTSHVAAGVRAASTTSVGEVQTRTHAEGESQERIESSSRVFANPNRCHAVTYLFHRLMKKQRIRFRLVAIERVIDDPEAPATVDRRPSFDSVGGVSVQPQRILATRKDRLEVERIARASAAERRRDDGAFGFAAARRSPDVAPIDPDLRAAALAQSAKDLAAAGLTDENGKPSDRVIAELSWEREELLPTPGLIVKGCLDECSTCEPALKRRMELELVRIDFENRLLERRIELLEKSQEYRCCPAGEVEEVEV